jgi:mannitol/fructose-specific phosphotransferase system IIA component (Ntr-type)
MKLTELVAPGAIIASLNSRERDGVIAELVDALVKAGCLEASSRDELVKMLVERERRSTTGFGEGIAVPHAKHVTIGRVCAAIGLSPGGVDFASVDLQPVFTVVLLLSPREKPDEHLHAMEVIFKVLSQDTLRRLFRQATTVADVQQLLEDVDAQAV